MTEADLNTMTGQKYVAGFMHYNLLNESYTHLVAAVVDGDVRG